MVSEYRFTPLLLGNRKPLLQLVCRDDNCDRSLLTRWFTTVSSMISVANVEFHNLLEHYENSDLQFVKTNSYSCSLRFRGVNFDNCIPVIVGTQLWFMLNDIALGSSIGIKDYRAWAETIHDHIDIFCPICCFTEYIPLCCFFVNRKMYRLPTLAAVDSRKIHVKKPENELTVYISSSKISESGSHSYLMTPFLPVKSDIAEMQDMIYNYSFYTIGKIFAKRIAMSLSHVASLPQDSGKAATIMGKLAKDLCFGNVTSAISKNTPYASSEMSGQSNESFPLNDFNSHLLKSDIETRKGYVRIATRYISTPVNQPIQVMFAPLHCVKIISSAVNTKSHQSLQTSALPYVDKVHTSDNKNVGCHMELLPGIKFASLNHSFTLQKISNHSEHFSNIFTNSEVEIYEPEQKRRSTVSRSTSYSDLIKEKFVRATFQEYCCNHASDYSTVVLPDFTQISLRLTIEALESLVRDTQLGLCCYYWKKQKVCVVYNSENDIVDERFELTPLTRECLLKEFPERWFKLLSPTIDGNIPMLGTVAQQFLFVNHNAAAKQIAGIAGLRHAVGLPVTCKLPLTVPNDRYLVYPQNDLVNLKSLGVAAYQAIVVVAALRGHGVEDGIIVNKASSERGLGMVQNDNHSAQIELLLSGGELVVAVPTENNMLQVIFRKTVEELKSDPHFFVQISIPEDIKHRPILQDTILFDITGIALITSYSHLLRVITHQSASRIMYHRYYDVGEIRSRRLIFDSIAIYATPNTQKCDIVMCITFSEFRLMELGDKHSTDNGQKVTTTVFMSEEDCPILGGNDRVPPHPDIVLNISSTKRQTLGLNFAGLCRTAKVANPDLIDLSAFRGDESFQHSSDIDKVFEMCRDINCLGNVKVFDGITGRFMGYGDVYTVLFFRYEQEGMKSLSYTHYDEDNRTPNGDFVEKGRGKGGGGMFSQTQTELVQSQGSSFALLRELQQIGEPRTHFSRNSGIIPESLNCPLMSAAVHGYHIQPLPRYPRIISGIKSKQKNT